MQFSDPPVTDSVEIPPSGRQPLRSRGRGRRGLQLSPSQDFQESPPAAAAGSAGLCPQLAGCADSVAGLVGQLSSASWQSGLLRLLTARGITTVGELASRPASELAELPVRSPRLQTVETALNQYLVTWRKR